MRCCGNPAMRVFISYRRDDSADVAGRIDDRLAAHFGRENVFKDVDSIPPGVDFRKHLHAAVSGCDLALVVIGRDWLDARDEEGNRRLDDEADFVRIEIEAALGRGIPVVPALVREGLTWSDLRVQALSAAPVRLEPKPRPRSGEREGVRI